MQLASLKTINVGTKVRINPKDPNYSIFIGYLQQDYGIEANKDTICTIHDLDSFSGCIFLSVGTKRTHRGWFPSRFFVVEQVEQVKEMTKEEILCSKIKQLWIRQEYYLTYVKNYGQA